MKKGIKVIKINNIQATKDKIQSDSINYSNESSSINKIINKYISKPKRGSIKKDSYFKTKKLFINLVLGLESQIIIFY